jgi:hypothetical protein
MRIPFDIWYNIFHLFDGDIVTQLRIKSLCKELYALQVIDLFNIKFKYKSVLSDQILLTFKHVKLLNASQNSKITDKGIKHMMSHTLNTSYNLNITDDGIKHMNLHTLLLSIIK